MKWIILNLIRRIFLFFRVLVFHFIMIFLRIVVHFKKKKFKFKLRFKGC